MKAEMTAETSAELARVRSASVCVATPDDIGRALDRMAAAIVAQLPGGPAVMLCVMNGALMTAAGLLSRLPLDLRLDYLHASRYGDGTRGDELEWLARPREPLAGANVILVDDIFDEGATLEAVVGYCRDQGASSVLSAVLVDKRHRRRRTALRPDVVGLALGDSYLFGYGMDYRGYLRNLPAIYALRD